MIRITKIATGTRLASWAGACLLGIALTAAPAAAHDARGNGHRADSGRQHHRKHQTHQRKSSKARRHGSRDFRTKHGHLHSSHRGASHERRHFAAPSVIPYERRHDYRAYRHDDVYYRPHRHRHSVYVFPVVTGHRRTHRAYAYCEGRRYGSSGSLRYDGPYLSVRFDWD